MRKSLAEKARTGQRVHQLENLTAEGKAVADPEDDKLWLSLESKHHLLEFDYARWGYAYACLRSLVFVAFACWWVGGFG